MVNGSHTLTAVAQDAAGNTTTSAGVSVTTNNGGAPANTPASHWTFNEASGTTAADSSANSNNLTLAGGAGFVSGGQISRALSLNGVNGEATDASTTGLGVTSTLTITGWLKPTSLPSGEYSTVVTKGNFGLARGYGLNIFDGKLNFVKIGNVNVLSTVSVPVGSFHHVAVTWEDSTDLVKFYLDGILSQTVNSPGSIVSPVDADPVTVGRFLALAGSFYNGLIDDLRIYDRVLTAAEILAFNGDSTPPNSVAITTPTAGAVLSGTATVSATASDNVAVAGVQFRLDGANLGAEDTTVPYSITWNTNSITSAQHTLSAVARDTSSNTTSSANVLVTVDNVNICP